MPEGRFVWVDIMKAVAVLSSGLWPCVELIVSAADDPTAGRPMACTLSTSHAGSNYLCIYGCSCQQKNEAVTHTGFHVYCIVWDCATITRHQGSAPMHADNRPITGTDSEELQDIQHRLLSIVQNEFHDLMYPNSLCTLADLKEVS